MSVTTHYSLYNVVYLCLARSKSQTNRFRMWTNISRLRGGDLLSAAKLDFDTGVDNLKVVERYTKIVIDHLF